MDDRGAPVIGIASCHSFLSQRSRPTTGTLPVATQSSHDRHYDQHVLQTTTNDNRRCRLHTQLNDTRCSQKQLLQATIRTLLVSNIGPLLLPLLYLAPSATGRICYRGSSTRKIGIRSIGISSKKLAAQATLVVAAIWIRFNPPAHQEITLNLAHVECFSDVQSQ